MTNQQLVDEIKKKLAIMEDFLRQMYRFENVPIEYSAETKDLIKIVKKYCNTEYEDFIGIINSSQPQVAVGKTDVMEGYKNECRGYIEATKILLKELGRMFNETDLYLTAKTAPHDVVKHPAVITDKPIVPQTVIHQQYNVGGNAVIAPNGTINIGGVVNEYTNWLQSNGVKENEIELFKQEMIGATKETIITKLNGWITKNSTALGVYVQVVDLVMKFSDIISKTVK